jgi:hypothetical protein
MNGAVLDQFVGELKLERRHNGNSLRDRHASRRTETDRTTFVRWVEISQSRTPNHIDPGDERPEASLDHGNPIDFLFSLRV